MNVTEELLAPVLAADPEAIIASGMDLSRPEWLDDWRRWPQLQAVRRGNLLFVPPDLLQRHSPRILDGAESVCRQLERVRVDAHHRSDPLTGRRHAHDHATPLVQVDADILPAVILFHQGPPSSWGLSGQPKRYARVTVTRGAEAPLLSSHQVDWFPNARPGHRASRRRDLTGMAYRNFSVRPWDDRRRSRSTRIR